MADVVLVLVPELFAAPVRNHSKLRKLVSCREEIQSRTLHLRFPRRQHDKRIRIRRKHRDDQIKSCSLDIEFPKLV